VRGRPAIVLAALVGIGGCTAPPALVAGGPALGDTLAVEAVGPIFEDARAVALDPTGALTVADAGAATVLVLEANGSLRSTLGGPGTGDYAFLDPSGVDPGNGLVLTVADTGNGRLQRFSRDGRLLDSTPVPTARDRAGEEEPRGEGRPVAVAAAVTGELYAVEETGGVVLRWDDRRRFDRVIGGMEAGEGALRSPVGLALGPDGRLFVADRGHAAVLVYDAFGQYLRRIADGQLGGVVAVAVLGDRLAVVLPRAVRLYGLDGRPLDVLVPTTDASLVDVAGAGGTLYVLTRNRLFSSDAALR
jgi:hypothetical protein